MAAGSRRTGGGPPAAGPRVSNAAEAERLIKAVLDTIVALEAVLEQETALVRDGRIADALAEEAKKSAFAASYLRDLETLKANAIALARFAPAAMDRLKASHRRFAAIIATNQAVLATARAVAEGLLRSLADEMGAASRTGGYAPPVKGGRRPGQPAPPLAVSKKL